VKAKAVTAAIAESSSPASLPTFALSRLLDELASVVMWLPAEVYSATFDSGVSGSVGEHIRHCLDHISALLAAGPSATLSYDHRQRGTAIEREPGAALQQILRLKTALDRWPTRPLDEPIRVSSIVAPSGQSIAGWSTLARELAFVVSHTIHHQATIAVLLALHGFDVPDRFGHSPSTPRRT
jgi:uncharacterized damage-inducible protein DinB